MRLSPDLLGVKHAISCIICDYKVLEYSLSEVYRFSQGYSLSGHIRDIMKAFSLRVQSIPLIVSG